MGIRLSMLYLLKYLDEEFEGKLILKSILIFKDLKCLKNKNYVLLFERHKHSPISSAVIIAEVMAVNRGKHSDHNNEPDYVICASLDRKRYRKMYCTAWSYRTGSTDGMCLRF